MSPASLLRVVSPRSRDGTRLHGWKESCDMSVKRPDPVDVEVGHRIRIERLARGLSQTTLANQLGVTFQQVQKYEKGVNRVGAGRLTKIAEVLGITVGTFFTGKEVLDTEHSINK